MIIKLDDLCFLKNLIDSTFRFMLRKAEKILSSIKCDQIHSNRRKRTEMNIFQKNIQLRFFV